MIDSHLADRNRCVLIIVDMQPTFLRPIERAEAALHRTKFIAQCARLLDVPTIATTQYSERMGGLDASLVRLLESEPHDKTSFSCSGCTEFVRDLKDQGRDQAVLIGIETHICVNQTAQNFVESGWRAFVCADATAARSEMAHDVALKRMRHSGVIVTHTESVAYEWMEDSSDPRFRDMLDLVKSYSGAPMTHRLA